MRINAQITVVETKTNPITKAKTETRESVFMPWKEVEATQLPYVTGLHGFPANDAEKAEVRDTMAELAKGLSFVGEVIEGKTGRGEIRFTVSKVERNVSKNSALSHLAALQAATVS